MKIEVTSVSRKRQLLSKSAAAVYVITQDDIARSGASTIPEVLRMAPGLMVARIDSSKWVVGARGDSGRFANKMLVLIDGRTVYTNLYSGVYWDQNDTLLEDVERIEIIRGPGGTMWGANAVNAVINIITKSAANTHGLMATAGSGTEDRATGAVRYGGPAGEKSDYRGYVKYSNRGSMLRPDGYAAHDEWSSVRGGGRFEWAPTRRDRFTVHGDLYRGNAQENVYEDFLSASPGRTFRMPVENSGGYALGRWERAFKGGSDLELQAYVHRENRVEGMGKLDNTVGDLDFQHRIPLGGRHDVLWGAGYRVVHDQVLTGPLTASIPALMNPQSSRTSLYSTFVQDEFSLVPNRLVITAGTKVQHNAYTGIEIQPNVRALWTPNARHSLWGAVSRAVRTPSRRDQDLLGLSFSLPSPAPPGSLGILQGNPNFGPEVLLSHEGGWRWQRGNRLSLDITGYVGQVNGLQRITAGNPILLLRPAPRIILPLLFTNAESQKRGGIEASGTVQLSRHWRVHANYTWYRPWDSKLQPGVNEAISLRPTPYRSHQGQFRSSWDLRRGVSLDCSLYAFSSLPILGIPSGVRADVRIAVRRGESSEWSLGVRDLLDAQRPEFVAEDYVRSAEARHSVYFKVTWGR